MRLHLLFAAAAAYLATCDAVSVAGPPELSKIVSSASALSTNAVQNTGRFLRTSKTVQDDGEYDHVDGDDYESDDDSDDDSEERTFDAKIAQWRGIFDDYYKLGYNAEKMADDVGATYYIKKYGKNLGKLSKKEEYQKAVAFKAYLEKVENGEITAPTVALLKKIAETR